MIVTQHARFIAFFRLLRENDIVGIQDALPFHVLEQEWHHRCGLRRTDLICSIDELILCGSLRQFIGEDGTTLELTDRGVLHMREWLEALPHFRWSKPIESVSQYFNTHRVLARAQQRTVRRIITGPNQFPPSGDRRSMA